MFCCVDNAARVKLQRQTFGYGFEHYSHCKATSCGFEIYLVFFLFLNVSAFSHFTYCFLKSLASIVIFYSSGCLIMYILYI